MKKKTLNTIYSKRRYLLINKETQKPLLFKDSSYSRGSIFCEKNPFNNVAVFNEPFSLSNFGIKIETNEFINFESKKLLESAINSGKYKKAKDKLIWKKLSKEVEIKQTSNMNTEKSIFINGTKTTILLLNIVNSKNQV